MTLAHTHRHHSQQLRPGLALLALCVPFLSACGSLPFMQHGGAPAAVDSISAPAPLDPVHAFLADAPDGAARALVDAQTGAVSEVTAGSSYFAASGRQCRRYTVLQRPEPRRDMLACRGDNGAWQSTPSLTNFGAPSG